MPAILNLCTALSTAATGAQPGIRLNRTPFKGGYGRDAILSSSGPAPAIPAGVTVLIQGSPLVQNNVPATGDASWVTLLTLTSTSKLRQEIPELPYFIRVNVSVAAAGAVTLDLEQTT